MNVDERALPGDRKFRDSLFRQEAVAHRRDPAVGAIVAISSPSMKLAVIAAVAIGCAIVGILVWGTYSSQISLSGRLVPNMQPFVVYTPQHGRVVKKYVDEGDYVEEGSPLYTIEALAPDESVVRYAGNDAVDQIYCVLESEVREIQSAIGAVDDYRDSLFSTERRFADLPKSQDQEAISKGLMEWAALLYLNQQIQSLRSERREIWRLLVDLELQRANHSMQYESRLGELIHAESCLARESAENAANEFITVAAPSSGRTTNVSANVGKVVNSDMRLLSIEPDGFELQGHLHTSSVAVRNVSVGKQIALRYEAFPHRRFGFQSGTVLSISDAAYPAEEWAQVTRDGGNQEQAMYHIVVSLPSQSIAAYGETQKLQAGMEVEADVIVETRKIYAWILDPHYRERIHR